MRYWLIAAGLVFGIGFGFVQFRTTWHGAHGDRAGLSYFQDQAITLSHVLRNNSKSKGHYPTNDEGLPSIRGQLECAVRCGDGSQWTLNHRRITASGLLTWWGDPIIYENRRGLSATSFTSSMVGQDQRNEYSRRVDDGIYLWSIGAERAMEREHSKQRLNMIAMLGTVVACAALLSVSVILALRRTRGDKWYKQSLRAIGFTLWAITAMFLIALPALFLTMGCGCHGGMLPRTPELTRDYTAVMRRYRDMGVISRTTFDKRISVLKLDGEDAAYRRSLRR